MPRGCLLHCAAAAAGWRDGAKASRTSASGARPHQTRCRSAKQEQSRPPPAPAAAVKIIDRKQSTVRPAAPALARRRPPAPAALCLRRPACARDCSYRAGTRTATPAAGRRVLLCRHRLLKGVAASAAVRVNVCSLQVMQTIEKSTISCCI
jgi:hypothetical protein